jgi:hypothetical protein
MKKVASLFRQINEGVPGPAHSRYQALIARRKEELLTAEEAGGVSAD